MSIPVPASCKNPECRKPEIKPISCVSQKVAIDDVDVRPVFALLVTYRCLKCGHTWAVQGYSAEEHVPQARAASVAGEGFRTNDRGW